VPSFDIVNYSLRPSKSIQRQIVFDGIRELQADLDLERLVYIGFGSIWFTDFVMAHKLLRVDDMVSIEGSDIGYRRAVFNSPYATVRVKAGFSGGVLPTLYEDEIIKARPWLVWLDYDYEFNENVRDDVRSLVENAPANSVLIFTFNGRDSKYGKAQERPDRLRALFGAVVPDDLTKDACKDGQMPETLAEIALDYMRAVAADLSRPGGFIPAFRVVYKDSVPMVTVGGVLPAKGAARIATDIIGKSTWPCRPEKAIVAPHLTIREAAILQAQLPKPLPLSRAIVQGLGFDLEDEQIATFQTYYRQYPAFAQIVT
jgi:hypothetical protein